MGKPADYEIVKVENDKVFIIDLNLGNKSVTNDAENVYIELKQIFPDHRIIYKDTMGHWDEIVMDEELSSPREFPNNVSCGFVTYSGAVPNDNFGFPISVFLRK